MSLRLARAVSVTLGLVVSSGAGAGAGSRPPDWVLVPVQTRLYTRPDPAAVLAEADEKPRVLEKPYLSLRKIRALDAGWTEVETDYSDGVRYSDYQTARVRLFVRSEDLVPVLVRRTTLRLADGRSRVFPAGAPVQPSPTSARQVVISDDERLEAVVPPGAVGHAFPGSSRTKSKLKPLFGWDSGLGIDHPRLPAKTPLYWSDGSPAGRLEEVQSTDLEVGKRSCFKLRIGRAQGVLCADKTGLLDIGAAMDEAFQNPQGVP